MSLPLGLIPTPRQAFYTVTGDGLVPVSNGFLRFFVTGGSTPAVVYADPAGEDPLGVFVQLDADGYAPALYMQPFAYRVVLQDEDAAQLWQVDGVNTVAESFLDNWGAVQTEGNKGVTDGYVVLAADNLVTVNEPTVNPCKIYLQRATLRGTPVIIKNLGPTPLAVYPFSSETIEDISAPYPMPAASSPNFPTITFLSDRIGNNWIWASHKLA